jgi:hypothetical protein
MDWKMVGLILGAVVAGTTAVAMAIGKFLSLSTDEDEPWNGE